MRTVHLLRKYNPDEWGGTETAIQRLFEGLRQHAVEAVVYCPQLDSHPANDPLQTAGHEVKRFHAFVPIAGISSAEKRQMISVGGNLMSFDLIGSLWREANVSVIHTHTLGRIGGIALTVARQKRVPFVVTIHGGVLDLPASVKSSFNTPIAGGWEWGKVFGLLFQSHRLFRDADAIVTCNEKEAALLREKYPAKRIEVQRHGIPLAVYQLDCREKALGAFPSVRGKQVIVCVGRIDSIKNQHWLVEQAPQIFQEHPDAVLVFVGACTDAAYGESMRGRIRQLGLEERVLVTGGLPPNDPRLIGLLQVADAFVLCSVSETFGLAILEAWAAGTPVISSRTSGASALVRDGENGWLFDLEEPQNFHRALNQTLQNPSFAKGLVRQAAIEVSTEYDIKVVAGRMKKLYEELIEGKQRPAGSVKVAATGAYLESRESVLKR